VAHDQIRILISAVFQNLREMTIRLFK